MVVIKLNGWIRLWILVSLILLIAATVTFSVFYQSLVEGAETIEIKTVKTEQILTFPGDMTRKEISEVIQEYEPQGTEKLIRQSQVLRVAAAMRVMEKNNDIKSKNKSLFIEISVAWLACIVSLLLFGYGISWVKNGFKNT